MRGLFLKGFVLAFALLLISDRAGAATSDLALTLRSTPTPISVNQLVTWQIGVTNLGPDAAANVVITNQLPAGASLFAVSVSQGTVSTNGGRLRFAVGSLAVGQGLIAELTLFSGSVGSLTNSAWSASNSPDSGPGNNTATNIVAVLSGNFLSGGQMLIPRAGHTATLLTNGLVLITGGYNSNGTIRSVELFNPATGNSSLVGDMMTPRYNHTATLLPNGKVLIAGHSYGDGMRVWTELFDPVANTLAQTGDLNVPRTQHAASLLPDGRVLATGGIPADASTAETYDYLTGTWTLLPPVPASLISHTSTVLTNGQVLLAGGWAIPPPPATIFAPVSNSFGYSEPALQCRENHTASQLPDGRILIAGGGYGSGYPTVHASAEFFAVSTGQFTEAGRMVDARATHTASLLTNGTVLLAGGTLNQDASTAEVFDPVNATFRPTARLIQPRLRHTATTLPDGRILILGGEAGSQYYGQFQSSAEIYDPAGIQSPPALRIHDVATPENAPGALAFPVTLSAPMGVPVTVDYSLSIGSAWFGEDFVPTNGVLTIPPGSTNEIILIPAIGDNVFESDEIIFVTLSNAANAVIAQRTATGTFLNDDPQPTISVLPAAVVESNLLTSQLIFPLVLSNPSFQSVTVTYTSTNGTATAPEDYLAASGVVTFTPGVTTQFVTILVKGDIEVELAETVGLELSSPTNATISGIGWGNILNDDGLAGTIHYLELSAVPAPQHHSLPFPLTVSAKDYFGAHVNLARPLFLRPLATNVPPLLFDLEHDAATDWRATNFTYLYGYYDLQPYDVTGAGIPSQALRIVPSFGKNGGVAREIELVGGVKYSVRFDAAQANVSAPFQQNRFDYTLKIGSTVAAYLPLDQLGRIPPGQVDRRHVSGEFTAPSNGVYTLQILLDTSFPASYSAVYVDNLRIESPGVTPSLIFLTNGIWTGNVTLAGTNDSQLLQALDVEGHTGISNPFQLAPHANLSVNCVRNTSTPRTFDFCNFTLSVFNAGPSPASLIALTNKLPDGFTFVSGSSGVFSITNFGVDVIFIAPALPAGGAATATLTTRAGAAGSVTNQATAFGGEFDVNSTNNSVSLSFVVSPPRLSINGGAVAEIPGGTNAVITLALSSSNNLPVHLELLTTTGSALGGADYLATNISVMIPPGILTQLVSIVVFDDALDETNETFGVTFQNVTNAVAGAPSSATVTIIDNDLPTLSFQQTGANLQLSWAGNYVVQSNHLLQASGWVSLTNASPFTIPIGSVPSAFFRLISSP